MARVITGLEVFLQEPPAWAARARLGLLSHPAAVAADLAGARDLIATRFPGQLKILFSPQHGLLGEKQDNMIASADFVDPDLQLPVVSLYGPRMAPPAEALAEVDAVLVDMQDVGTRVYTFAATLAKVMAAAAPLGKKVVVLDRPNPIGGTAVEGNLLRPEWASFVGPYPLPMRHGFTLGELARYYRVTQKIDCDLEVMPLQGWRRGAYFDATGLPWVLPSPNLPTLEGCLVYPGQVLLEGTNLSEGRGTTRPFELFGAPFLEPRRIKAILTGTSRGHSCERPTSSPPSTSGPAKYAGASSCTSPTGPASNLITPPWPCWPPSGNSTRSSSPGASRPTNTRPNGCPSTCSPGTRPSAWGWSRAGAPRSWKPNGRRI